VQDGRIGVAREQAAGRLGRLTKVAALELDDRKQVQNVLVVGARHLRLLDLGSRGVERSFAQALARADEVDEEDALVDRRVLAGGSPHDFDPPAL
jgi:hypothetical protein